jgi:hypothetical protein
MAEILPQDWQQVRTKRSNPIVERLECTGSRSRDWLMLTIRFSARHPIDRRRNGHS